jgi:hypothetical protein
VPLQYFSTMVTKLLLTAMKTMPNMRNIRKNISDLTRC